MAAAPEHHPGDLIPPLAYPDSILSQQVIQHATLGLYTINVITYNCAVTSFATPDEDYEVLTVVQNDNVLLQYPHHHQAALLLQASPHLLNQRSFFFVEWWLNRAPGGHQESYAEHISRFDIPSLTIHRFDYELVDVDECYKGIDVDATETYLLIVSGFDGCYTMRVFHSNTGTWFAFDCSELWDSRIGVRLTKFRWGTTRATLRCNESFTQQVYDLPIDWDRLRVLWPQ